jgi:hypothetical protein
VTTVPSNVNEPATLGPLAEGGIVHAYESVPARYGTNASRRERGERSAEADLSPVELQVASPPALRHWDKAHDFGR